MSNMMMKRKMPSVLGDREENRDLRRRATILACFVYMGLSGVWDEVD